MNLKKWIANVLIASNLALGLTFLSSTIPTPIVASAKTKVQINHTEAKMVVGNTLKLSLTGAKGKIKWSSKNSKIASVTRSGKVTANKSGKTTIKATFKNKSYKCVITVKSATLSHKQLTLRVGQSLSLEFKDTTGMGVWESDNEEVATVNKHGFLNPLAEGTATITSKLKNETYTCTLKVVKDFGEEDFVFGTPIDDFTNYIDYDKATRKEYVYYDTAGTGPSDHRGIKVGSTQEDFEAAYGYVEYKEIDTVGYEAADTQFQHLFNNSAYPRTKTFFIWTNPLNNTRYYKKFYFDRNGTVVLIITSKLKYSWSKA